MKASIFINNLHIQSQKLISSIVLFYWESFNLLGSYWEGPADNCGKVNITCRHRRPPGTLLAQGTVPESFHT